MGSNRRSRQVRHKQVQADVQVLTQVQIQTQTQIQEEIQTLTQIQSETQTKLQIPTLIQQLKPGWPHHPHHQVGNSQQAYSAASPVYSPPISSSLLQDDWEGKLMVTHKQQKLDEDSNEKF